MYSQSYKFQDNQSVLWEGEAIQDICNFSCRDGNHFLKATEGETYLTNTVKHTNDRRVIPHKTIQF